MKVNIDISLGIPLLLLGTSGVSIGLAYIIEIWFL